MLLAAGNKDAAEPVRLGWEGYHRARLDQTQLSGELHFRYRSSNGPLTTLQLCTKPITGMLQMVGSRGQWDYKYAICFLPIVQKT